MDENYSPARSRATGHKNESRRQYNQYTADETGAPGEVKLGEKPPNALHKRTHPSFLGLTLALVLAAIVFRLANKPSIHPKVWTKKELARYNGTDEDLPILLSILGSVFDVSKGRTHYGVGGSYNHFAGRDASRAFVTGNFTGNGLTDSVKGLSIMEEDHEFTVTNGSKASFSKKIRRGLGITDRNFDLIQAKKIKSIVDWRNFYHKSYIYVGKLVGRYYNQDGKATKELKGVEAKAARGIQLFEQQKLDEEKVPNCNSRWSQQTGGEVWCEVGYPRLVQKPTEIALLGKMSKRCACIKEDELGQPGLELYESCDPHATLCKVQ